MPDELIAIEPYRSEHREAIAAVLINVGWEQRYIDGQLLAVEQFAMDAKDAAVFVAHQGAVFAGYISVQFYSWNRLSQIHGLVVDPSTRRRGIATSLVAEAERFVRNRGARGIYVDTPVTNTGARAFYTRQQYQQDYIMTAYYDADLDGVTYLKLFDRT